MSTDLPAQCDPQETAFRLEGVANPDELAVIRKAIADIGLSSSVLLTLGEEPSLMLTPEGFRQSMLDYVPADPSVGSDGGWFITWEKFKGFAFDRYVPEESGYDRQYWTGQISRQAKSAFGHLLGRLPTATRVAERQTPFSLAGQAERVIDPVTLLDALDTPLDTPSLGLVVGRNSRKLASFYLIEEYAAALLPNTHIIEPNDH